MRPESPTSSLGHARTSLLSAALLLGCLGACGNDPVGPDWCSAEEVDFRVEVGEDVVFLWAPNCALEEIQVVDALGRIVFFDQGVLTSPIVFAPGDSGRRETFGVMYKTPDWQASVGFAVGKVEPIARWVSTESFSADGSTSTLAFDIEEVDAEDQDNGRAYWNFLVERILDATYDAEARKLEFLVVGSAGGVTFVTGYISEDGRTMDAFLSGTLRFGTTELGSFNETFAFERRSHPSGT